MNPGLQFEKKGATISHPRMFKKNPAPQLQVVIIYSKVVPAKLPASTVGHGASVHLHWAELQGMAYRSTSSASTVLGGTSGQNPTSFSERRNVEG